MREAAEQGAVRVRPEPRLGYFKQLRLEALAYMVVLVQSRFAEILRDPAREEILLLHSLTSHFAHGCCRSCEQ